MAEELHERDELQFAIYSELQLLSGYSEEIRPTAGCSQGKVLDA